LIVDMLSYDSLRQITFLFSFSYGFQYLCDIGDLNFVKG
jgi:hypothetical protein